MEERSSGTPTPRESGSDAIEGGRQRSRQNTIAASHRQRREEEEEEVTTVEHYVRLVYLL